MDWSIDRVSGYGAQQLPPPTQKKKKIPFNNMRDLDKGIDLFWAFGLFD